MILDHYTPANGQRIDRSGSDARRLGKNRDDPARRVAGLNFHDRTHQPRDERPLYRQGCFLAAMLVIATAPRQFWISRFERHHASPSRGTRNGSATIRWFRQSARNIGPLINLIVGKSERHRNGLRQQRFDYHEIVNSIITRLPRRLVRLATA